MNAGSERRSATERRMMVGWKVVEKGREGEVVANPPRGRFLHRGHERH